MKPAYGLHWFRRDLRLMGNAALAANLRLHPGRVLGVFCIDPAIISREDLGAARFLFLLRALRALQEEMRSRGGDLLVIEGQPDTALLALVARLETEGRGRPAALSFNRDYEPFSRARDERVMNVLEGRIGLLSERDHLVIEPRELLKGDGGFYQVFGAFRKRWLTLARETDGELDVPSRVGDLSRVEAKEFSLRYPPVLRAEGDAILSRFVKKVEKQVGIALPAAGEAAAWKRLRRFGSAGLETYAVSRDFPGEAGTSQLSVHLKHGALTVPGVIAELDLLRRAEREDGPAKFLEELIWREFHYHVLWHRPDVEKGPFQKRYARLKWENREDRFAAWCEGRTGYPIVDAGMRQLNATGWMHNRVRMIVASFLTKDLLVDYRWGERYFMKKLLDGDLAPNNGGWQWAASTGCDPQPYFRIFNPTSQGKRFDPKGEYLARWAPEYLEGRRRDFHEPREPIVDHAVQREKALKLFSAVR